MRLRLLSPVLIAFGVLLAVPPADAAEARRAAASPLADRDDDGRAARSRPDVVVRDDRDRRDDRSRRDGDWDRRDDRSRRDGDWVYRDARRGRSDDRHRGRGRSRVQADFPFLGGGYGLEFQALPRYSRLDGRDLERILGRRAFDRLEREVRRAGLRGPLHGMVTARGHAIRLDLSAGNVFLGRLIDHDGDWRIDESRASDVFHRGRWR
ncbi:MAG TPA: hypothetical protein VF100_03035 [Thermoanaerobaculia bacterium]